MKNLTWQNPGQLFVAQELIKIVKLKCCGIKADEAPAAPESVYGLETIEDVFQRFEPTVDLCHVDAEGNEIKEIMTFTGLGDFGAKKIKEKSDFLSKLDIEKEQGVRITRQLTSNRALQKALENPEVKNAIMDVIESSIEEILANQKKVEL